MSARKPAFLASDQVAEVLAAGLWDYAARLDADSSGPTTASLARLVRRSARELLELHDIKADDVLVDARPPGPEYG